MEFDPFEYTVFLENCGEKLLKINTFYLKHKFITNINILIL